MSKPGAAGTLARLTEWLAATFGPLPQVALLMSLFGALL